MMNHLYKQRIHNIIPKVSDFSEFKRDLQIYFFPKVFGILKNGQKKCPISDYGK
jgi:hypothetical protein